MFAIPFATRSWDALKYSESYETVHICLPYYKQYYTSNNSHTNLICATLIKELASYKLDTYSTKDYVNMMLRDFNDSGS